MFNYGDYNRFLLDAAKVIPTVYDDSLSYYEVLSKFVNGLTQMGRDINTLAEALVAPFDPTKPSGYLVGDYCWYNDKLYKCVADNTGSWDDDDWTEVVLANSLGQDIITLRTYVYTNLLTFSQQLEKAIADIANPYQPENAYPVGSYVSYDYVVYKSNKVTTPGSFNIDDWDAVVAFNEFKRYIDDLWEDHIVNLGIKDYLGYDSTNAPSQAAVTQILENFNALPYKLLKGNTDGIFSWNGYECTVEQDVNGDTEFSYMVNSIASMPEDLVPGETYIMFVKRSGTDIRVECRWWTGGADPVYTEIGSTRAFTIPSDAVGCQIRIHADASATGYTEKILCGILKKDTTNAHLFDLLDTRTPYYGGVYPNGEDLDDIEENRIYFLNSGYSYDNKPTPSASAGFLLCLRDISSDLVASQLLISYSSADMYYRRKAGGVWEAWETLGTKDEFGDGKTISTSQSAVTQFLKLFNSFPEMPLKGSDTTIFKWNGYECTVTQPAGGTAKSCVIYNDQTHLPSLLVPGNSYTMFVKRSSTTISLQIHWYDEHGTETLAGFGSPRSFTVPANAVGCRIRVYANASTPGYTDSIIAGILTDYDTNDRLFTLLNTYTPYYKGVYPQNGNLNDINDISVYFLNSGYNYTNAPNDKSAFIVTMREPGGTVVASQLLIEYGTGVQWYRRKGSGVWGAWQSPNASDNNFAKMCVKGNSIMVGSVWTLNDSGVAVVDHFPSAWGNSPYSVIAKKLNIPEQNLNSDILYSSKGFLHNPIDPSTGEPRTTGSLLDNIIGNATYEIPPVDLSSYDYLLTQLSRGDIDEFVIGTVNDASSGNTIAAGIVRLMEYLNTYYPECRLILLSATPNDPTISADGGDPFTKVYSGSGTNQTINALDAVVEQMAEMYHFKYITWQNLNLSYHFQKYTGGIYNGNKINNNHANNENTYRKLGEYAAEHI